MMNWSYIAGFFDGEGSLSKNGGYNDAGAISYVITIPQSESRKIGLDKISEFLNAQGIKNVVKPRQGKDRGPNFEPMFRISIWKREDLLKMFDAMLPYLTVKKILVQDVRRLYRMYPSLRGFKLFTRNVRKLTDDQVRYIRAAASAGVRHRDLAAKYQVSVRHIFAVIHDQYLRKVA